MAATSLTERAREIEAWVEDCFVDPRGVLYTCLDVNTSAPVTDAFFESGQTPTHLPGTESFSPAERHTYENCGMTTAAYLQSLLYRYAVERDPSAFERARRCLSAIKDIYDMGKQLEEGFFPKIYGNRFSEQTSTDQVLYVMLALDHFHRYASDVEQKEISHMIASMIRFWVKRGYRYKYFWHEAMLWPLGRFPSLLLMGYKHSGDAMLKNEYDRLLAAGVNQRPNESRLAPKLSGEVGPLPYELEQQAWLLYEMAGAVAMDGMQLCYLLQHDPRNSWAAQWKKSLKAIWDEGALALAPDGLIYLHMLVDMTTGEPRRPEPGLFRDSKGPEDWIGYRYLAGARSADSTLAARMAVQAEPHLHDETMRGAARLTVRSLGQADLRTHHDPERYLPELTHLTELYGGDDVANWLWAYWQGRVEGIFRAEDTCLEPETARVFA